jgi:hypothetical protein
MEYVNKQMRCIFSLVMLLSMLGFSQSAFAVKQCIKNNSGTSLNVAWYNTAGKKHNASSNANLTLGFTSCKESNKSGLSYAVVNCNGCALAKPFAQAGIAIGGGVLLGACGAATAGQCLALAPEVAEAVVLTVQMIPNSDWKQRVVVPQDGQTIEFIGTAFDLRVK